MDELMEDDAYIERLKASNIVDLKIREQIDFALYQFEEASFKGKIKDLMPGIRVIGLILSEFDMRLYEIENRLGLAHKVEPIPKNEKKWRP